MDHCHYHSLFSPVVHVRAYVLHRMRRLPCSVCHKQPTCCLLPFQGKTYYSTSQVVLEFVLPPVSQNYESLIDVFIHSISRSFIHALIGEVNGCCSSTLASPSIIGPVAEVQYCAKEQQWSTQILMMPPKVVIQMVITAGHIIIFCKLYHACSATW